MADKGCMTIAPSLCSKSSSFSAHWWNDPSANLQVARCINTPTVVFVFVFEYSKGRRPCFYSSTSSKTHETHPSKDDISSPLKWSVCAYRFTHTHTHTHTWGPLVVTRLRTITGNNTRISCIGLQWKNGWIWWNIEKMSYITTFLQWH